MKRMIAAICAAMMLCGLAGCGTATMPDVTGMSITDARSKLNSAGFYSVDVKDMNGKAAFDGKIQSQKPKAGKEASTSDQVELVVKSAADQAQEAVDASKKLKQAAEDVKGKDAVEAIKTLQDMSAVGSIKDKNGADVSEQRITADVTNAFGAKQKGLTYECSVTGTTDAPQVVDFNVY